MKEDSLELQKETIKCLSIIIESSVEDEELQKTFSELVPIVITAIDALIGNNCFEEDVIYQVLETICSQIEIENRSIDRYIPDIVKYIIGDRYLLNKNLPISMKESGLEILTIISDYRRPIYTKNIQLLTQVLQTMFVLGMDKTVDETKDTQETLSECVMFAFQSFSRDLPKKKFWP